MSSDYDKLPAEHRPLVDAAIQRELEQRAASPNPSSAFPRNRRSHGEIIQELALLREQHSSPTAVERLLEARDAEDRAYDAGKTRGGGTAK